MPLFHSMAQPLHQTCWKLSGSRAPPSPLGADNGGFDDHDPSPPAPFPPEQRAKSTPALGKEKKKTSSLPPAGPSNRKQEKVEKKIGSQRKLAYEMTYKDLKEHTP